MMTCSYSSLDPEICFIKVTALLRKPYVFEHHESNGLQLLYRAKKKTFDLCLAIKRQSGPLLIEESEEEQVPRQFFI